MLQDGTLQPDPDDVDLKHQAGRPAKLGIPAVWLVVDIDVCLKYAYSRPVQIVMECRACSTDCFSHRGPQ
eukprot:12417420-Karenia_brevis.AAC.1